MDARASSWSRPALVLTIYLGLGAAGLVWSSLRGVPSLWQLPDVPTPHPVWGVLIGGCIAAVLVLASRMAVYRFEWARQLHRDFRSLLGPLLGGEVFVLAAASALGEEMFFRGAMLPALASGLGSPVLGLVISSLVFALLHIGPKGRYWPWTVASLVAGLLFGQLFLWTGDLTGAVAAHFLVNFFNLRHVSTYDLR